MGLKQSHYHFNLHYPDSSDRASFIMVSGHMCFLFCELSLHLFNFTYWFIGAFINPQYKSSVGSINCVSLLRVCGLSFHFISN